MCFVVNETILHNPPPFPDQDKLRKQLCLLRGITRHNVPPCSGKIRTCHACPIIFSTKTRTWNIFALIPSLGQVIKQQGSQQTCAYANFLKLILCSYLVYNTSSIFNSCNGLNDSDAIYSKRLCRNWAAAGRLFKSFCRSAPQTNNLPFPTRAS